MKSLMKEAKRIAKHYAKHFRWARESREEIDYKDVLYNGARRGRRKKLV